MANNLTQFSFAIPLKTDEERVWAQGAIDYIAKAEETEVLDTDEFYSVLPDDYEMGCATYFEADGDGLWIHSDGDGSASDAVPIAVAYLRKFHPDGAIGFEWSSSCSRPLLDEFGGGAVVVTVDDDLWISTSDAMLKAVEATGKELVK